MQNFGTTGAVLNGANPTAHITQNVNYKTIINAQSDAATVEIESVKLFVNRFLQIYESHGIPINQIPKFAADMNLQITDFKNYDTILNVLDNKLIEWTCARFGINRNWLEGDPGCFAPLEKEIYPSFDCYQNLHLIEKIISRLDWNQARKFSLFAFKNGELVRKEQPGSSYIVLVLRENVGLLNDRPINRYIPVNTIWYWDYYKTRFQAKAIFLLCKKFGVIVRGYDLPEETLEALSAGELFPEPILNSLHRYTWHPENYVATINMNQQAKEADDFGELQIYIQENCGEIYHQSVSEFNGKDARS